ncbi:MAG: aminodeoxychorismate synthase component I [Acidimicrobiia bacterium]|nr:aminodeoxychorismate synthase component I [Acidimicrobiia bacterium]
MTEPDQPSPATAVQHAVLRHLTADGRRWLAFSDPLHSITAWRLDEVGPAIDAAEAAQAAGHWVVGLLSYDAGPAFDPAITSLRHPRCPLVAFGVFATAHPTRGPAGGAFRVGPVEASRTLDHYRRDLARVRHHIAEGDSYQVNYTMRLRASFEGDPLGLFEALVRAQRADHVAYVDLGDQAVASASPELFLRRQGDIIETRPMKGTRPRHPDPVVDRDLADEVVTSAKDRAENTMIVDMTRNDLGRVAAVGSVEVTALHTVESYPTVHQLTSTVTARSRAPLRELLAACFPAASITGAPKVRTTELIAELEGTPRGVYTGAVGVLAPDGSLELNVAIRTAHVDRLEGTVEYGVGGGIVWDSRPDEEWAEAHDKARVLERARTPFRLLETMAWGPTTGAVLLDRHIDRLVRSAGHFGFDVDPAEIRRRVDDVTGDGPLRLRLLMSGDGAIELEQHPMPAATAEPWVVAIDPKPVASTDEFLRHKTTHRRRYDEALARFPDHRDVLLVNERGELTESTTANLVLEHSGRLRTPWAQSGLLPGTFRAELLDSGLIDEAVLTLDDLRSADRCFLINSVRGWIPITVEVGALSATR